MREEADVAIREGVMADGWQPIETAPKDGTVVGVWNRYQPEIVKYARWGNLKTSSVQMGWVSRAGIEGSYTPSHWMPLPAPPQDAGRTER